MPLHRIRLYLCLLLALLGQGAAWACQVCVVSSDKAPAFQEAYDNVRQELARSGYARQGLALLNTAEFLERNTNGTEMRLLITLGTDALRQVTARNTKTPVLAGLIPRLSFERVMADAGKRGAASVSALYLDQPFGRQLDLLRLALPQVRRVGVLWGPESIKQQALLQAALQARGLDVREGLHSDGQGLMGALQAALDDADVLLGVADAAVYNTATVSNILLTSYRAKVAVLAFSPAYVKAGALMSVHSTAEQAGVQLAAMATHFLQNNSLPITQYPADFTITVNDYVARSLGLVLDVRTLTDKLHRQEKRP